MSDDVRGRIYRIVYRGAPGSEAAAHYTPCPSAAAPAGAVVAAAVAAAPAKPPEGTHPNAGAAATAAVAAAPAPAPATDRLPPGITRETVALGNRIFHGKVADGACSACHNSDGSGTVLGPNLTSGHWLWSDGSYEGIVQIISQGVNEPKQFRAPMPPMGGTKLTPEQLSAVAAYVWSLSHKSP